MDWTSLQDKFNHVSAGSDQRIDRSSLNPESKTIQVISFYYYIFL